MSGYTDTAFSYDEADLGLDPETKLRFKPNQKELELFKLEKLNMYKGTWMVCFVYGISAIILLSVIFFTDWGRTYIYNKFFPAVITYVLGAIIIIIYLLVSIFSIKPRKLKKSVDTLPVCPDYWKLEKVVDTSNINDIVNNVKRYSRKDERIPAYDSNKENNANYSIGKNDQYILNNDNDIILSNNKNILKYKCVPDQNVFGSLPEFKSQLELVNNDNNTYKYATTSNNFITNIDKPKYLYVDIADSGNTIISSSGLKKYAELSGVYKSAWTNSNIQGEADLAGKPAYFDSSIVQYDDVNGNRYTSPSNIDKASIGLKKPLICNEIYPNLLDTLENKQKNQELKCEYAKKCGISWSYLDCYKSAENTAPISVTNSAS
jgi:hypothetical protein